MRYIKCGDIVKCVEPAGRLIASRKYKVFSTYHANGVLGPPVIIVDVQDCVNKLIFSGWRAERFQLCSEYFNEEAV
jgi:hypothetical protein